MSESTVAGVESSRCQACPPTMSAAEADRLATVLKALADPIRVRLFSQISAAEEVCVCDLGDFGVSQPTVSHHLRKLREAGLIEGNRRGTWVYYRHVPGATELLGRLLP